MRNLKIAIFSTTDVNKAPIRSAMVKAWLDKSQYNEFIGTKIFYLNNVNLMDSNKTDIMSYSPDLCLFFSHISWDENKLAPLIEFLKQNFPKIIIAVANDSVVQISEESAGKLKFDYILRGDVIINFSKIIKDILYGKPYGGNAPIILYDNGSCNDINNIPSPVINDTADFSLYKTAQLYLSRGCSNRCSYCNIPETKLRFFSKERVLAELNSLLEKAPFLKKIIVITNDIFSKEVSDFIPVFKKVAEDKKIFFYFFTNASSRHDEKILASANSEFFYIRAGVQSFNIMSLKSVHRAGDEKSMKENLDRLRKNAPKAKIGLEFILGLPHERAGSFFDAIEWSILENYEIFVNRLIINPYSHISVSPEFNFYETTDSMPYFVLNNNKSSMKTISFMTDAIKHAFFILKIFYMAPNLLELFHKTAAKVKSRWPHIKLASMLYKKLSISQPTMEFTRRYSEQQDQFCMNLEHDYVFSRDNILETVKAMKDILCKIKN